MQSSEVLPEAFAIIRESMDRNIGIRSIFDPDNNFDPDQFSDGKCSRRMTRCRGADQHGAFVAAGSDPADYL